MRRSVRALVLLAGSLALAPFVAPAYARSHPALIICPLASSQVVIPCCGPPLATPSPATIACCGPLATASPAAIPCCATAQPIACPAALTIGSAPNPSTAGRRVTITGRWLGATAGTTVELWEKLPRAAAFKPVAQASTGATGQYQLVRLGVQTSREYYITAAGARSATIAQQVRAIVTLTRSLQVHVTPNHGGERIVIEQRTKHGWKVMARPRLTRASSSKAAVPRAIGTGRVVLRAVFPGDVRNARSLSPMVEIKR